MSSKVTSPVVSPLFLLFLAVTLIAGTAGCRNDAALSASPSGNVTDTSPAAPQGQTVFSVHYAFDEASGATAFNSDGPGYDGIIYGASRTTGKVGGALQFGASGAYMETPPGSGIIPTADFSTGCVSIGAWLNLDDVPCGPCEIIGSGYYGVRCLCLQLNGGKLEFLLADSFNNWDTVILGERALTRGAWHQVSITYDGSTAIVYIDGTEDSRRTVSFAVPGNCNKLYVGAAVTSTFSLTNLLPGRLDELRIAAKVWSPAEIAAYYNSTK